MTYCPFATSWRTKANAWRLQPLLTIHPSTSNGFSKSVPAGNALSSIDADVLLVSTVSALYLGRDGTRQRVCELAGAPDKAAQVALHRLGGPRTPRSRLSLTRQRPLPRCGCSRERIREWKPTQDRRAHRPGLVGRGAGAADGLVLCRSFASRPAIRASFEDPSRAPVARRELSDVKASSVTTKAPGPEIGFTLPSSPSRVTTVPAGTLMTSLRMKSLPGGNPSTAGSADKHHILAAGCDLLRPRGRPQSQ